MSTGSIAELRERLENGKGFQPVLNDFIRRSIEEEEARSDSEEGIPYHMFYAKFIDNSSRVNADMVESYCESPIERMFMNSLILLFVKSRLIDLQLTEPWSDVEKRIAEYRTIHENILSLADQYREMTGDDEMIDFKSFFDKRIAEGKNTEEDYRDVEYHRLIVDRFEWDSYHVTLQAGFPNFKVEGRSIRTDMYIWKPSNPDFKLIVECDGFKYHSSKDSFVRDRKRDRLFKSKGYQVVRFSGTEIWKDPISVSSELFDILESMEKEKSV
ncbi:MAG: endonuclease domain-containing protein [Flavobacteriales bacterium]